MTGPVQVKILDDDKNKDRILRDGETMTVKMFMKDGSPNPGFTQVQRAIAATRAAMQSFDAAMHRPGFRYGAAAPPTGDAAADAAAAAAAVVARDAAYSDYEHRQSNAWRGTADAKLPPAGSYPASEADEGDACTIDGRPGTLCTIDGHEGYLECVPDDDSDIDTGDSATDAKVKAAKAKQDAYAAYDSQITDAWRNK